MSYSEDDITKFIERISCDTLSIQATNLQWKQSFSEAWPRLQELTEARQKLVKNLTIVTAEGEHHVHLDSPEKVVRPILDLLNKTTSKL